MTVRERVFPNFQILIDSAREEREEVVSGVILLFGKQPHPKPLFLWLSGSVPQFA